MHAGEALWNLYTILTAIERRYGNDPDMVRLAGLGQESCRVISQQIQVPPPPSQQLEIRLCQLLPARVTPTPTPLVPPPARLPSSQSDGGGRSEATQKALDNCQFILDNKDDVAEHAADFADSIATKAESMRESILKYNSVTPRMAEALQNMRDSLQRVLDRGDD